MSHTHEGLVVEDACGVAVRRFDPMMFADDEEVVLPEKMPVAVVGRAIPRESETADGDDTD